MPTTVDFPSPLPAERQGTRWVVDVGGIEVSVSNLDKLFWAPEGLTKADLLAYYYHIAGWLLPYAVDRPLTLKRMPDGADGDFFYEKQAPAYTPEWVATAPLRSRDTGKTIDYLLAQDAASLVWLANLGCIEVHVWHGRIDAIGRPDYAFFDLDPFAVDFDGVREVALVVRTALDRLGLRSYPRTSGATGMQIYVPIDRVHSAAAVREWVGRVCRLVNRADPERTTMEWAVEARTGKVFLDHSMNTEGKNIAATWSLRPERQAPVATPLTWEEVEAGVSPTDFTIRTVWERLAEAGDHGRPIVEGGQDLRGAMQALGMDPDADAEEAGHEVTVPVSERLARYRQRRDFARTPEPGGEEAELLPRAEGPPQDEQAPGAEQPPQDEAAHHQPAAESAPRFVVQHHLATRLHHDLRLEREGVAVSWALPKGLPDVPALRHLAVQTEDHPVAYMAFSGEIPEGEYGAGPVRIWDEGTYETLDWQEGKVSVRLAGARHRGEYHLFRTGGEHEREQWLVTRAGEPADLPADPPRLLPMLASDGGEPFDDPEWLYEVKWDGVRILATTRRPGAGAEGGTQLTSRHGNDVTDAYPELGRLWERVLARNAVLDGEIVALGDDGTPSFARLQRRMHLRDATEVQRARTRMPVTYLVFDLLFVDGESLVDEPLSERLDRLDDVLIPGAAIRRSEPVPERGRALFEAVSGRGMEGVIAKRARSRYRPGKRSPDWRKLKVRREVDCVVGGWLPGEGGRSGALGSLLLGLHRDDGSLAYVGRVGTGFDAAELERVGGLLAERAREASPFTGEPKPPAEGRWVGPELVCRVAYGEATDAGMLRAPSYKGLVDADPGACLLRDLEER